MRELLETLPDVCHAARRALVWCAVALAAIVLLLAAWPVAAQTGEANCRPGTQYAAPVDPPYVHPRFYTSVSGFAVEGAAVIWHCWTGTGWQTQSRMLHAQDVGAALRAEFERRIAQWARAATPAERAALAAQWDTSTDFTFCDRQIANAGYAARLCGLVRADGKALIPTADYQPPVVVDPPPPPPPAEVWKVAANASYPTRPTYAWDGTVRSTIAAAERVAVGSACNPAVGAGDYRGVLGRTDRVALCRKQ